MPEINGIVSAIKAIRDLAKACKPYIYEETTTKMPVVGFNLIPLVDIKNVVEAIVSWADRSYLDRNAPVTRHLSGFSIDEILTELRRRY